MAKLIRVYDPNETERKINLNIPEDVCPGLLEFMSELPYGKDTPLIRGVFYQWFLSHSEAGTLDQALNDALAGPGGMIATGRQSKRESAAPPTRKKRVPRQREITAKPGAVKAPAVEPPSEPLAPAEPMEPALVVEEVRPSLQPEPVSLQTGAPLHTGAVEVHVESVPVATPPVHGMGAQDSLIDQQPQMLSSADALDEASPSHDSQDATPAEPTNAQKAALDALGTMF
ncbi:hypothetical protein ALQ08_200233 [Pseudomonas syringae pv. delphinii]|jgi:hypothetical protein|uniref:Uncharacterized protein n=2 Tax=Pseudomonas TaxID=286 RepID=A0A3M4JWC9_9PSED|nr:hypothetical protein [Pseudomonas putida]RMQ20831.1 hypothetical protein ALQ08_200233 [Pseudomonas syringae pv. delphinii]